ncbi:MAG: hypothetical protein NVSMB2_26130 [Chloroflexota bacterium]
MYTLFMDTTTDSAQVAERSVVVLTTSLRSRTSRARAAYARRMALAVEAAYKIEFAPLAEPVEWAPKPLVTESAPCIACGMKVRREVGDTRNVCLSCQAADRKAQQAQALRLAAMFS